MNDTQLPPTPKVIPLTPELVQQLAERVYAMWLKECEIENERRRLMERWQTASSDR